MQTPQENFRDGVDLNRLSKISVTLDDFLVGLRTKEAMLGPIQMIQAQVFNRDLEQLRRRQEHDRKNNVRLEQFLRSYFQREKIAELSTKEQLAALCRAAHEEIQSFRSVHGSSLSPAGHLFVMFLNIVGDKYADSLNDAEWDAAAQYAWDTTDDDIFDEDDDSEDADDEILDTAITNTIGGSDIASDIAPLPFDERLQAYQSAADEEIRRLGGKPPNRARGSMDEVAIRELVKSKLRELF